MNANARSAIGAYLGDLYSGKARHYNGHELTTDELLEFIDLEGFEVVLKKGRHPMKLMLRARFKSWCHAVWHLVHFRTNHRIWRMKTHCRYCGQSEIKRIYCDCGKEFL